MAPSTTEPNTTKPHPPRKIMAKKKTRTTKKKAPAKPKTYKSKRLELLNGLATKNDLADMIRECRIRQQITQLELADLAGIGGSTVSRIESGEDGGMDPGRETIWRLCKVLKIEPDWFFTGPPEVWWRERD